MIMKKLVASNQLSEESRDGEVFFAAWLRTAYTSPCEWLWEASWEDEEDEPARFVTTLASGCGLLAPISHHR